MLFMPFFCCFFFRLTLFKLYLFFLNCIAVCTVEAGEKQYFVSGWVTPYEMTINFLSLEFIH